MEAQSYGVEVAEDRVEKEELHLEGKYLRLRRLV